MLPHNCKLAFRSPKPGARSRLRIPRPLLLFARVLRDAQLVEIIDVLNNNTQTIPLTAQG